MAPRTSLAVLMTAALFLDLIWPVLVLVGVETVRIDPGNTPFTPLDFVSYPWSHSAATTVVWSVLFGAAGYAFTRDRVGALVSGLLVASHWVLDLVSHRADLPLWRGGPKVGLGLWYSVPATLVVESAIFVPADHSPTASHTYVPVDFSDSEGDLGRESLADDPLRGRAEGGAARARASHFGGWAVRVRRG